MLIQFIALDTRSLKTAEAKQEPVEKCKRSSAPTKENCGSWLETGALLSLYSDCAGHAICAPSRLAVNVLYATPATFDYEGAGCDSAELSWME